MDGLDLLNQGCRAAILSSASDKTDEAGEGRWAIGMECYGAEQLMGVSDESKEERRAYVLW